VSERVKPQFDYLIFLPKTMTFASEKKPICIRSTRSAKLQFVTLRESQEFLMSRVLKGDYINHVTEPDFEIIQIATGSTMTAMADWMKMKIETDSDATE
jgi:hypothetical protein